MVDGPLEPTAQPGLIGTLYRHRRLIAVVGAIWLTLVLSAGIFTSTLEARHGLHVFGPSHWVAGQPGVLRVGLADLTFSRFAPLDAVHLVFENADGEATAPERIATKAGDFVQGAVPLPTTPGAYTAILTADAERGTVTTRFPITVEPADTPVSAPPKPKDRKPPKPDVGPARLDVFPVDQVLPGDLSTRLAVRATDAQGRPTSTTVHLSLAEGRFSGAIPEAVITDRNGLASFAVRAQHPRYWFDLRVEGTLAARRVVRTPTQLTLDTPRARVTPGSTIPVQVRALHRSGPVFVDLWHGARWLSTTALTLDDGEATGSLTLPPLPDGAIVWVQAYRTAYLPQKARGGRHLVVTDGDATATNRHLARTLLSVGIDPAWSGHLAQHADGDPGLTRVLLGRFARPDRDPALVANSTDSARQTVLSLKSLWQQRFAVALGLTGVLMFVVVGLILRQNSRAVQAAWAEAGGEDAIGTRKGLTRDAAYVFGVLALFLFGLLQLLLHIKW